MTLMHLDLASMQMRIIVKGFDVDPAYGPYFDTIIVNGNELSFEDFKEGLNNLFNAPDNTPLNI